MTAEDRKAFGKRLVGLRSERSWSQKKLAEKLGISAPLLSEIENGERDVSKKVLAIILTVFAVNLEWLQSGKGDKSPTDVLLASLEHRTALLDEYRSELLNAFMEYGQKAFVLVLGDINADYPESLNEVSGNITTEDSMRSGGKGLNAAKYFKSNGHYEPVLVGGLGTDKAGEKIKRDIDRQYIISLLNRTKKTAECRILFNDSKENDSKKKFNRKKIYKKPEDDVDNNYFSVEDLTLMLDLSGIKNTWYIYFIGSIFFRERAENKNGFTGYAEGVMGALAKTGAPVIFRLPREAWTLTLDEFNLISEKSDFIIGELGTFRSIITNTKQDDTVKNLTENDKNEICKKIKGRPGQYILIRYGEADLDKQSLFRRSKEGLVSMEIREKETKYTETKIEARIGYNEYLVTNLLWEHDPKNPDAFKWHWEWPNKED
jgi:transcriptional regulator with XRE-family HTH domain